MSLFRRFQTSLITFVIGVGAVFLFLVVQPSSTEVTPDQDPALQRADILKPESEHQDPDEDYICSGIDDVDYLEPAIKKWFHGDKFTGKPMRPPIEYRSDGDEYFPSLVDANGDGKKELAVQSNCAGVGNCEFWLFKKNGRNYRILLRTSPGAVQTFRFLKSKSNGFFDLETKDHLDAWSSGIAIYRYDGRQYKTHLCSTYSYSYLKDGKLVELQKPIVKRVNCSEG